MPETLIDTDNIFHAGMTSDSAVVALNANKIKPILPAKMVGHNPYGGRVQWYLKDATLTFERDKPAPAPYRLMWIGPAVQVKPVEKPKKKTKRGRRGKKEELLTT